MLERERPELSAAVATAEILKDTDFDNLDAFYLGQPYCLLTEGNLLTDLGGLARSIKSIRREGKKAYVTTPIVPENKDLPKTVKVISTAVDSGADAVEIHDAGVYRWARDHLGAFPVHLSSFFNIYQPETAQYYRDRGVGRLVPANELLQSEVDLIKDATPGIEFAVPVHGNLSLGMSYACLLRIDFPSRELKACKNQCRSEFYLDMGDWKMRCVGTSLVTADDFAMIEHIPHLASSGYRGYRLETHFDAAAKINALADIYKRAMSAVASGTDYPAADLAGQVSEVCGATCNGWRFGLSGRDYFSLRDEDPLTLAMSTVEDRVKSNRAKIGSGNGA